jgi:lipoprotein signal peptidase
VERFGTFNLASYPHRAFVMLAAMALVFCVDFAAKSVAIGVSPSTLLFHTSTHAAFGQTGRALLVLAWCSLLACVLPSTVIAVGAGVALGGAVGNLASRYLWARQGGSPDFIPFGDGSTGNLADVSIMVGGAVMVLGSVVWLVRTLSTRR